MKRKGRTIKAWAWKWNDGRIPFDSVNETRRDLINRWPWEDGGKIIRVEIREALPRRGKKSTEVGR